jgi:hypothetical protein
MKHTSIRLTEKHLDLIKGIQKSPTQVIKLALVSTSVFGTGLSTNLALNVLQLCPESTSIKVRSKSGRLEW